MSQTTDEINTSVDWIVEGIDIDASVDVESGSKDAHCRRVLLSETGDLRFFEFGEKAPPIQVEPLEDEENQEEVG